MDDDRDGLEDDDEQAKALFCKKSESKKKAATNDLVDIVVKNDSGY